jgi:Mg2+ and Co2+ transporter CorA
MNRIAIIEAELEQLREQGRTYPSQFEQIEKERSALRDELRKLRASDFESRQLGALRRENHKPRPLIGFAKGFAITLAVVITGVLLLLQGMGVLTP